jgi:hypothetical protein
MKKFGMILLVLMLTNLAYGQGMTMLKSGTQIMGKYSLFAKGDTVAAAVRLVDAENFVMRLDTLKTGDTVKTMYFGGQYTNGFITLYDSAGVAITFYVERYDTAAPYATKLWTTQQMGFVDLATGTYTATTTGAYGISGTGVISPGTGLTKTYYINEYRPRTYRCWVPESVVASNKRVYIKWIGKN